MLKIIYSNSPFGSFVPGDQICEVLKQIVKFQRREPPVLRSYTQKYTSKQRGIRSEAPAGLVVVMHVR